MANSVIKYLSLACFFISSCVSVRLSSKLVHRYSDEAKAVWESRNGDVKLWPRRNSFEYFELLLSNDLKRRRLKIGSNHEMLFPSQGSHTFFYGNQFAWLHYTWIDIGTPNVSFLVALDVGSDLLWVPCDCIQCAPLSASYYTLLDRDLGEYNPALSSTSKHLSCSHQLCVGSTTCKSSDEPCTYKRDYYTENTSSSGLLIEDKLHLASVNRQATQSIVEASVVLGCGRKQSGDYLDGAAPDGVMGLGPGNISVPTLLAKAGLVRNSFSLCFDDNGSGRIFFGDNGPATQQTTPFYPLFGELYIIYQLLFALLDRLLLPFVLSSLSYISIWLPLQSSHSCLSDAYFVRVESFCVGSSCLQKSGFLALVDSGSSFTFLPTELYKKIVLEFDKQVKAARIVLKEHSWNYCYNASLLEFLDIPSMKLMFPMHQSFIHNPVYIYPGNQGYRVFCLTLQETDDDYGVLGQNLMVGYRMVFDRENLKLGWSNSKCLDINSKIDRAKPPSNDGSPSAVPTNGQKSPPNRHAIAPTTAARTSSRSSLTASYYSPSLVLLLYMVFLKVC